MAAGTFEYLWQDKSNKEFAKPTALSANEYINKVIDWVEQQVNDDTIFPTDPKVIFHISQQKFRFVAETNGVPLVKFAADPLP